MIKNMKMNIYTITILFSGVLSIVISFYYLSSLLKSRKNGRQSLKTPPGSTGLPFLGETLDFISTWQKGIPEKFVYDRMNKHSSTVIKTSLFGEPMALLCGREGNKFIFSNENKLLKIWWPGSVKLLFEIPDKAFTVRKLLSPYLTFDAIQKYVPIMDYAAKQHLQTYWGGRDTVKVHPLVKLYTSTLVSTLFLGIEDDEFLLRIYKSIPQLMEGVSSLPVNIKGTRFHGALKAKAQLLTDFDACITKCKSDRLEGKLSASKSMMADILNGTLEEGEISSAILALSSAAYDTGSALTCIIMFLGQHPHVYDNVLAEQREIVNSKRLEETLNWGDIQKMKYSWKVVCETLRLFATGGFREVISDFVYDGFLIPKGWKVYYCSSATQMNPKYFKDPEKFDPSKFEGNGPMSYTFIPFGGGPHMCPGSEYARIKILVFMHNLVTKFKWEQIFPLEKILRDPSPYPAKGLPIHLYPYKS